MKIALCLYGLQGNLKDKSGSDKYSNYENKEFYELPEDKSNISIIELAYYYWNKYFLSKYDIDVYIHSWEPKLKKELIKLYKPIKYKFEEQKIFDIPTHVLGSHERKQSHYSRWYSQFECNNLRNESNQKYDFIMMSRFDMAWSKNINFEDLKPGCLYYPGDYLHNNHSKKIQDLFHISEDKIMDKFCDLYNKIGEYTKLHTKFTNNAAAGISSHRISKYHIIKLGIKYDALLYRRQKHKNQSDYTVLRYTHELKNESNE